MASSERCYYRTENIVHEQSSDCPGQPLPLLMRIRVLDPDLRRQLGSLGDLTVPVLDLARLAIDVHQALIVENLQTGLALEDLCGTIAIMGLGNNVAALASVRWLDRTRCLYWGDIDTHGFAILNNARSHLPHLESLLMDAQTLLDHRGLWGEEGRQYAAAALPHLSGSEQAVYRGLKEQQWGTNVRLEQERIGWNYAWSHLLTKCGAKAT